MITLISLIINYFASGYDDSNDFINDNHWMQSSLGWCLILEIFWAAIRLGIKNLKK